ncbi:PPOX class F420-dependent oxidoreductase [Nocardia jinanensis]|uniref:PPOX class F420-dependent enzyme n=1 Tax=Nocardia jinanensis TaxID=382504 RepID=A0A917VXM1_9NOCA|nr:PPOX class F420-dependent oxidoreductase [Nocardia jinanensis]GGL30042.1 PPOX class F420-dependent enzyme [Nocardia jinanensis]
MTIELNDEARRLLDGKNFATVATVEPDGRPQTSVVWMDREGDSIVFSSTTNRRKVRNLARDPRIGLTVFDSANPYHSVDIQGTAELIEDPDKALPLRLSRKYLGQDPPAEPADLLRFIVRVTPERITGFSAPDPAANTAD